MAANYRKFNTVAAQSGSVIRKFNIIDSKLSANLNDTLSLSDNIDLNLSLEKLDLEDSLGLSDEILLNLSLLKEELDDSISLSDEILVTKDKLIYLEDSLVLSDDSYINIPQESAILSDTVNLSDDIYPNIPKEDTVISETITLSDSIIASTPASYATDIVYHNTPFLFVVTNENPAKLIKIDISGGTPSFEQYIFDAIGETAKNAKALVVNDTFNRIYVACAEGQVMNLNYNDLNDRVQIDTGDSDDFETITSLEDWKYTYVGSNDSEGEIVQIDETTAIKFNSKFSFLKEAIKKFNSYLHLVYSKLINSKFNFLAISSNKINSDFRFTKSEYDTLIPLSRTDFHVFINGIETGDVSLESIRVIKIDNEKDQAYFSVARKHDKLNYTLDNVASEITNQNPIIIKLEDRIIFTGKIKSLDCSSEEKVDINAGSNDLGEVRFNNIELDLSDLDTQRHLYDIITNDISILNPYIDPNEEDPEVYKGIKVDLGTKIEERVSKWIDLGTAFTTAQEVNAGTFQPKQNWTYFWWVSAIKYLMEEGEYIIEDGERATIGGLFNEFHNKYIGTSPSSLSGGTWEITGLTYKYQRFFDNIENELGYYYLGSAPYKEISAKNGVYIARGRWEDREDGFYEIRREGYNYQDYCKKVAEIEYDKIKNINGDVLPIVSTNINLTIDAFLYYSIYLNTRINIGNTTEIDIYKDTNGFPVSIKSIEINSNTMKVSLTCDNKKSQHELDLLDDTYPDEDSTDYITPELEIKTATKFDPARYEDVE